MSQLIIIIALFALMWFLLIRPQRQRQATQARMLKSLTVGDEIVTAGGLYGEITRLGEDDIHIEIAPGTVVRIAKNAVAGVMKPEPDALEEPDELEEPDQPEDQVDVAEEQVETPAGSADATGPTRS